MRVALRVGLAALALVAASAGCTTIDQHITVYAPPSERDARPIAVTTTTGVSSAPPDDADGEQPATAPDDEEPAVATTPTTAAPEECSVPESLDTSEARTVEDKLTKLGYVLVRTTSSDENCARGLKVETVSVRKGDAYAFVMLYETPNVSSAELYEKGLASAKGAVVRRDSTVYFVVTVPQNDDKEAALAMAMGT